MASGSRVSSCSTGARASVRGSYIINSASTAPALSLRGGANVELEQTFVQGAQALAVEANSRLEASSSVLAGPVSGAAGAVLSCTDTYGADYELLTRRASRKCLRSTALYGEEQ